MLFDVCQWKVFDPAVRWTAISLPPTQLSTYVERGVWCSIGGGRMSHSIQPAFHLLSPGAGCLGTNCSEQLSRGGALVICSPGSVPSKLQVLIGWVEDIELGHQVPNLPSRISLFL